MPDSLVTVEQAAEHLNLHPKTVLRYIRSGQLPATRVGKAYRISRARLDAFAGTESSQSQAAGEARATCVVDIPGISVDEAERAATLLQTIALTGNAGASPLHLETAFDPLTKSMKVVLIGSPADVGKLLEMLQLRIDG
ncbi:MAG: helix-turn-helix domain-containing protein [Armatimonas sp.]